MIKSRDFCSSGYAFGQFHGALRRLCTGIGEINRLKFFGKITGKHMRIFYLGRLDQLSVYKNMQVAVGLIFNGTDYLRMPVSRITNTDASDGIQVSFSRNIIQVNSFCPNNLKTQRSGGSLSQMFEE